MHRPICTIAYASTNRCWHPESYHRYAYRVSRLNVLIERQRTVCDPKSAPGRSQLTALMFDIKTPRRQPQGHRRGAPLNPSLYWTLIVVVFFISVFVFGTCIVSTPSFDSALIVVASMASGSAKVREKLP